MWIYNLVFYKSKSYLFFVQVLAVTKKPSPRISTSLYNQVYFDHWDQFKPINGLE